jgi:hypothetical protein
MKNIILYLGLILASASQYSYSQNPEQHKTSQDHTSADKRIKTYNADIDNIDKGMAYNNGYYSWLKSKKTYKIHKGEWDEIQDGYRWDRKSWKNPKHAWRYSKRSLFSLKGKKFKTVLKKDGSLGKEKSTDEK